MGVGGTSPVLGIGIGRWQSKQGQVLGQLFESPGWGWSRHPSKLLEGRCPGLLLAGAAPELPHPTPRHLQPLLSLIPTAQ